MFERYAQPLTSRMILFRRMFICSIISLVLIVATNFIGAALFHYLDKFPWVDSILNAVSIMMGVGIIGHITSAVLKIAISIYAIFSGIVFFITLAIFFAPLIHRFLHKLHLDVEKK